ncbi:MAG TPA: DsrH/TusB family sulfur metabolism protein [Methylomirabilota bacterium]|nr:DsrH/TusB family sulfur metabolism protein [Methylomirabilota bacterium]
MKSLHVIRDPNERLGLEIASRESGQGRVSLLLIQDAVLTRLTLDGLAVYALADDLEARGVKGHARSVDYDEAVRLMVDHDKVVVW